MGEVTTIGLDLAKHVFQVHGVDAGGTTVLRKQLRRGQLLAAANDVCGSQRLPNNQSGCRVMFPDKARLRRLLPRL